MPKPTLAERQHQKLIHRLNEALIAVDEMLNDAGPCSCSYCGTLAHVEFVLHLLLDKLEVSEPTAEHQAQQLETA